MRFKANFPPSSSQVAEHNFSHFFVAMKAAKAGSEIHSENRPRAAAHDARRRGFSKIFSNLARRKRRRSVAGLLQLATVDRRLPWRLRH